MLISRCAQIGADALTDQGQNVGARPAEQPCHHGRAEQATEIQRDQTDINRRAVLIRDQDVVHQRHGKVGRHERGGRRGQRQ